MRIQRREPTGTEGNVTELRKTIMAAIWERLQKMTFEQLREMLQASYDVLKKG